MDWNGLEWIGMDWNGLVFDANHIVDVAEKTSLSELLENDFVAFM